MKALIAFSLLLTICSAAPALVQDQFVLDYGGNTMESSGGNDQQVLSKSKVHFNMTFGNIPFRHKEAQRPLNFLSPLNFTNFDAMNVSASIAEDLIDPRDSDCALPNSNVALITSQSDHPTASRFTLGNSTSDQYFNLLGITLKPLGPAPPRIDASIHAWRISSGRAVKVYSGGAVWGAGGFVKPIPADFPKFFPGWGERVNAVEIEAKAPDGRPWRVCVGRIEFEVLEE